MSIIIENDHAGLETIMKLKKWLVDNEFAVKDAGTDSVGSVDYPPPDFTYKVADAVEKGEYEFGILI